MVFLRRGGSRTARSELAIAKSFLDCIVAASFANDPYTESELENEREDFFGRIA